MIVRFNAHLAGCLAVAVFLAWAGITHLIELYAPRLAYIAWGYLSFAALCVGGAAIVVSGWRHLVRAGRPIAPLPQRATPLQSSTKNKDPQQ